MTEQVCKFCKQEITFDGRGLWRNAFGGPACISNRTDDNTVGPHEPSPEPEAASKCVKCAHELPLSLLDENGVCDLCRPLTEVEAERVAEPQQASAEPGPMRGERLEIILDNMTNRSIASQGEARSMARELIALRAQLVAPKQSLESLWKLAQELGIYVDVNGAIYNKALTDTQVKAGDETRLLKQSLGQCVEALEDAGESLELALGRLGCAVEANDGGGAGHHDVESYGGIYTLRRIKSALAAAAKLTEAR